MSCSKPSMAKDVIKKKLRIAHNKTNEGHEIFPECDDFLTSIMQDMDNNNLMAAMCLNNFQTNSYEISKTTFQEKTQSNANQIPSRNHATLPKLKKYGLARKGPLMAKSQRTLQQLQHNRKLPKPRAHLAGLSNSKFDKPSEKSKTKDVYNARSICKFKNKVAEKQVHNRIAVDGNKMKKHSIEESKSKEITFKKVKSSVMEKKCPVREPNHIVENFSKKHESVPVKKQSPEKSSHIISCDQIADNSSDSDEFEKFIKKEKKDLPKKSKKKVGKNIKSQKSEKKVSRKRASKSVSTESESDLSDEESSNSYKSKKMRKTHNMLDTEQSNSSIEDKVPKKGSRKYHSRTIFKSVSPSSDSEVSDDRPSTSYKKRKKVHKKVNNKLSDTSKEESESQMDVYDEACHNSSSESEDLPPPSEVIHGLPSTSSQFSRQMGNQHKSELNFHSDKAYNIPSVVSREHILCNDTTSHEIPNNASLVSSNQHNILHNKISSCEIPNIASLSSNQPNILQYKTSSCEIPNIASMVSSDQPNILHKSSSIHSLMGSAQPNVSRKTPDVSPLGSVRTNIECVALQNNSVSNNSWQEKSPESLIVDLEDSSNECESSFTVIPKIVMTSSQNPNTPQSYSEESEIELIDVIVPPDLPESAEHSDKPVGHKNAACTKNSSNELNIKTEKVYETIHTIAKSQNTKSNPQSQTSLIKQYEVAYTTGICQKPDENNESKTNVRKQLNLNNELQSSTVSNAKDSLVLNKVKEEPCDDLEIILDTASSNNSSINLSNKQIHKNTGIKVEKDSEVIKQATAISTIGTRESGVVENAKDVLILNKKVKKEPSDGDDCEIILETTSSSNTSSNLSNAQIHSNRNIKVERNCKAVKEATAIHSANDTPIGTREVVTENEQKLHEIQCSTLTSLTNSHSKMVQPLVNETINQLHPFNIKALLDNLKKEFATYQEILVTEQSVETTFKLLEKCQAERLKSLKTKIIQCLESAPSNSDCNSIKMAVNKLLDSSELNSTKVSSVCPGESSSTSDISMQDLKTLATMNLVPLSSISEKDIKPNLSELQCAVKQEPSPSYEINSMSFGEKCIVCAKDASAACQQCAKVFFCSNECGRKYWEDGHKNACIK